MPAPGNIHVDTFLTNISIGYVNEAFYADQVANVVPVKKRSDKYVVYNKDTFLRSSGTDAQGNPKSLRRPGSRSTEFRYDLSNNSFYAEMLAKHRPITDEEVQYEDAPLSAAIDTTIALTESLKIDWEYAVAKKALKRANYASSHKAQLVVNTTSWASGNASKPISVDIPAGKRAVRSDMARRPTHMLLNYSGSESLQATDEYVQRIKYVTKEALTEGGLLTPIKGLQVMETLTLAATSDENASTVTTGDIWVDDQGQDAALIFHRGTAAGLRSVSFMTTFECPDASLGTQGFVVKRWREEWRDSEIVEVRVTRDVVFPCTDGSTNGDRSNGYASGGYVLSGISL